MKASTTLTIFSALIVSAWAQDNTNSTQSNLIPTGISDSCTQFLNRLNGDATVATCLNKIIDATDAFDPKNNNNNVNSTVVSNTLNNICSTSFDSCKPTVIRGWLADFYSSCQAELISSPEKTVVAMYDVLYLVVPLKDAICAKDAGGKFCVQEITVTNSTNHAKREANDGPVVSAETLELLKNTSPYISSDESNGYAFGIPPSLVKRQDNQTPLGNLPNADLYRNTSLPYLFISPNNTLDELCKTCTQEVIGAYVSFESVTPYALGLSNSPILSGQIELWSKLKECPDGFVNTILDNSIPDREITAGASTIRVGMGLVAFVAGALALLL